MDLDYHDVIVDSLTLAGRSFATGELAYLALTSKVEFLIRDRLAFQLHQRLAPNNLVVAREWNRTDLAILEISGPKALIELKAMYTFDPLLLGRGMKYAELMKKDLAKSLKSSPNAFALLLATHPSAVPVATFATAIK